MWSMAVSDGGAHHDRRAMDEDRAVQKEAEDDDFILHEKVGSKVNFAVVCFQRQPNHAHARVDMRASSRCVHLYLIDQSNRCMYA